MSDFNSQHFGVMLNPGNKGIMQMVKEGWLWGLDNGAFGKGFQPDRFFPFVEKLLPYKDTCLFITVPDKVGDAAETLALWRKWSWRCREYKLPLAFVAQDGMENHTLPLNMFDVLFLGGTTEWKLSPAARKVVRDARGKPLHVGKVNSKQRIYYCMGLSAQTVDGTMICYGRKANGPSLKKWMKEINEVGGGLYPNDSPSKLRV